MRIDSVQKVRRVYVRQPFLLEDYWAAGSVGSRTVTGGLCRPWASSATMVSPAMSGGSTETAKLPAVSMLLPRPIGAHSPKVTLKIVIGPEPGSAVPPTAPSYA